jgi:hypothetical protein
MLTKLFGTLQIAAIFACAFGQNANTAKRVYDASQDSVFLVYLNDNAGQPEALGSAFVVAPKTLITNAHVVEKGVPVLAVGPVRIPVTVVARDTDHDLAVLTVAVDLTSRPLSLSDSSPAPGEQIFAIGNPDGLEKTISEGLVSGVRQLDGKTFLQITSPISHGSSGGPILDSDGQVVGVAVGMLTDGQNLNFAVPVSYVRELLNRKAGSVGATAVVGIPQMSELISKIGDEEYSSDDGSPYQQDLLSLKSLARDFLNRTNAPNDLEALACLADRQWSILDQSIEAAKKLYSSNRSADNGALLAYLLLQKANSDDVVAIFAKDGSPEKAQALSARTSEENQVLQLTGTTSAQAKSRALPLYSYALAGVDKLRGDYASAVDLQEEILSRITPVCATDLKKGIYQDLIFETDKLGRQAEAEKWFRQFASRYQPSAFDWDSEGNRRDTVQDYVGAADANERAAAASDYLSIDYCWASQEHFLRGDVGADAALADGRKCIDASVKNTSDARAKQFAERTPAVYRIMATVLEDRGVHDAALSDIKESLAVAPNDPNSLYVESRIFEGMDRYSECVSAAKAAIAASDGKFRWMQFGLGNCYFDMQDWVQAAASFRISAEADKTDAASAFNLGLSLLRQGFSPDAKLWFNEALKRNPSAELREKIVGALRGL